LHVKGTGGSKYIVVDDSNDVGLWLNDSSQVANSRSWVFYNSGTKFNISTFSDAGLPTNRMTFQRDGNVGIATTTPGSRLAVSGAVIISANGLLSTSAVDAGVALEVVGTISGTTLKISGTGNSTFSGSVIIESGLSGSTIEGFNLASCSSASQKLLYNNSTKKFVCGTDLTSGTFGTGNVLTIGDARYLKRSGGTMTGQLVVNITNGDINTIGLKVLNTLSGAQIHAEKMLTSSGRQDRKDRPRVPLSAKVVANMLSNTGAHNILIYEIHNPATQGFFVPAWTFIIGYSEPV
jgi:hypothetical protein